MAESAPRKTLDRELGLVAVLAISMGAMLGSGLFVLPGVAANTSDGFAGAAMPLAFLLSALIVLPAALCKAELATALPRSGGTYLYVERGLGPLAGTVAGIGVWFSLVFKSAFALVGLGAYFAFACGLTGEQHEGLLVGLAVGVCIALALLNLLGVKKSSAVQSVIVTATLIGLAVFVVFSVPNMETTRLTTAVDDLEGGTLLATAALVFVSFAGVTKICSIAEEVKDPDKTLPRGILLSLLLVTIIYVIVTTVVVTVVDVHADLGTDASGRVLGSVSGSKTPLAAVASGSLGPVAGVAIAVVAVLTLTSMGNSGMMTSSRFPLAMARDKLVPSFLSRISQRFRTPVWAIIITAALMSGLVLFVDVVSLAKLASAFKLLVFAVVNLSVVVLRESGARWYKPSYTVPGYPIVPILGFLGCIGLLFFLGGLAYAGAGGIICAGVLWYLLYVRRRVTRKGAVTRLYGETRRLSSRVSGRIREQKPGVIVPIFERDEDIEDLIPLAGMLAEKGDRLKVLRIEEVPDQSALGMFADTDEVTAGIAKRVDTIAKAYGLPCSFEDVVTHHAKQVLYKRAVRRGTTWIVMRWLQRSTWRFFVPDPVGWFVHHPPCDLVLFKETPGYDGAGLERFKKLLVFAEPGPNDALVIHVADRFAVTQRAALTFVYLLPEIATEEEEEVARTYHATIKELCRTDVGEPLLVRNDDDLAGLMQAAAGFDLLVLGAPPPSEVRAVFRRSFEDQATENAPIAVVRVKACQDPRPEPDGRSSPPSKRIGSGAVEARPATASGFRLGDVIDCVEFPKGGGPETKEQLFKAVAASFDERHGVGAESLEDAFWQRERKQSTALGRSVALPHATVRGLPCAYVDLWILETGIPFEDAASTVVDVVFVVVAPEGERRDHLRILARIGHLVLRPEFLIALRRARTEDEVRAVIEEHEHSL